MPWFVISPALAGTEHYWLALPCSALFYLTALRQVHNGFHDALGIGRRRTTLSLVINSALTMCSMHAVRHAHLRHHRFCPGPRDVEGECATMPWWRAVLHGPRHMWNIHTDALRSPDPRVRWSVGLDAVAIVAMIAIALLATRLGVTFLLYHVGAMLLGSALSAFFAVWTVHHDLAPGAVARTQRSGWKNALTYDMFFHDEHHMFPLVPTIHLSELARRIGQADPPRPKQMTF